MNNELSGMWKGVVVAQFDIMPGETEESHVKLLPIQPVSETRLGFGTF